MLACATGDRGILGPAARVLTASAAASPPSASTAASCVVPCSLPVPALPSDTIAGSTGLGSGRPRCTACGPTQPVTREAVYRILELLAFNPSMAIRSSVRACTASTPTSDTVHMLLNGLPLDHVPPSQCYSRGGCCASTVPLPQPGTARTAVVQHQRRRLQLASPPRGHGAGSARPLHACRSTAVEARSEVAGCRFTLLAGPLPVRSLPRHPTAGG